MERNKATITPEDVFKALEDTEFSFIVEPLKAEYESTWLSPSLLHPPPSGINGLQASPRTRICC